MALHTLLAVVIAGVCEPWCTEPCEVLNGNVQLECNDCAANGAGCHPGAAGYDTPWEERRQPSKRRTDSMGGGMGGGMGGMGAVRASVKPSGMPSLFSQPDAPRVDASAFSAPATLEDAATVRAAGCAKTVARPRAPVCAWSVSERQMSA